MEEIKEIKHTYIEKEASLFALLQDSLRALCYYVLDNYLQSESLQCVEYDLDENGKIVEKSEVIYISDDNTIHGGLILYNNELKRVINTINEVLTKNGIGLNPTQDQLNLLYKESNIKLDYLYALIKDGVTLLNNFQPMLTTDSILTNSDGKRKVIRSIKVNHLNAIRDGLEILAKSQKEINSFAKENDKEDGAAIK